VLPGHPSITVGGCIAGDIYGKNHVHQGLFHNFVKELTLYHPNHGFIIASKDKNEKLFNLSCGGFGLTGIITQTTLLLAELPQQNVEVRNIEVNDLFETFDKLKEFSANHAGVYSWNDLLSSFGKGFIVCSKFTEKEATPKPKQSLLQGPARNYPLLNLALTPPVPAIANYCYRKSNLQRNHQVISFYDFSFPIVTKSWYYSLYGRTGFIEKQILVPKTSANDYLKAFKVLLSKYRPFIGLTSCKIFNGEKTLLRFDGEGVVLTLDVSARTKDKAFLNELDKLNGKFNAFTNLLKDSHIDTLTAKAQHPEYEEFKTSLMEFDPNRIFVSELSRRLAL
jgi:decaprenylphospho-beta-D-ribofuranose 2-oxidase